MLARKITAKELCDLHAKWENPTVDTEKYFQCVLSAWEIDESKYETLKADGFLVQRHKGRYYAGA